MPPLAAFWSASGGGGLVAYAARQHRNRESPDLKPPGFFPSKNRGSSMGELGEAIQDLELQGAEWSNLDDLPDAEYDSFRDCSDLGDQDGYGR